MIDLIRPDGYAKLISTERLLLAANAALKAQPSREGSAATIRLTNNRAIRRLNRDYRGFDEATDVLSFENDFLDPETGQHYLGDIVISLEKARAQAKAHGNSLQHEVEMLVVHGMLHLLGADHDTKTRRNKMSSQQDQVLEAIGNPLLGSIVDDQ